MWKRKCFAIFFTLSIGCQSITYASPLTDIDGLSAEQDILFIVKNGIMEGITDSSFAPDKPATKKTALVAIAKAVGIQPSSSPDLDHGYIQSLVRLGVIGAHKDEWDDVTPVKREDIAVILFHLFHHEGYKIEQKFRYRDQDLISLDAQDAVSFVTDKGFMKGEQNFFHPRRIMSRSELAMVAKRIYEGRKEKEQIKNWKIQPEILHLKVGEQKTFIIQQDGPDILAYTPVFGWEYPKIGFISPEGIFTALSPGSGLLTITIGKRMMQIFIKVSS